MYTKIGIPENNSLKSKIEELYEWCDKRDNDDELGKTYFNEPIDEDKLNKWEEANGVKIPETYKEWLRFTEKCLIDGSSAMFWGTDDFHHNFMPDNLTVIGEMSGDGEVVCFSNDNGEFMGYYEGDITYRTNDFSQVIDQIFERNSAWGGMSKEAMELFMKFGSYKKETTDLNYHNDIFRPINFKKDIDGNLICPNNKKFIFLKRVPVKRNKYGREEEKYVCEDCSNCPFKNQCHKSKENRVITVNEELTSYHKEVIDNLECIHGALLRMNRSIQSEGTFGIIKEDRKYKRIVRKGLKAINLEIFMISCGYNLMKYHNKKYKTDLCC